MVPEQLSVGLGRPFQVNLLFLGKAMSRRVRLAEVLWVTDVKWLADTSWWTGCLWRAALVWVSARSSGSRSPACLRVVGVWGV